MESSCWSTSYSNHEQCSKAETSSWGKPGPEPDTSLWEYFYFWTVTAVSWVRNSLDACRVCEGRSGLPQFKCKPGRLECACLYFLYVLSCETTKPLPMAMEITECSHLYSVKGSLTVHGEPCFGFASWLQHGKYGSTAPRHCFRNQREECHLLCCNYTYCMSRVSSGVPKLLVCLSYLAAGRCEIIQIKCGMELREKTK